MKQPNSIALVLSLTVMVTATAFAGDKEESLAERGFAISPIPKSRLKFQEEERERVGLGSFIVNAIADCSGCHSFPQFLEKSKPGSNPAAGDPFEGLPSTQPAGEHPLIANFNAAHYLAGGQCFGPFMTRNLTPDAKGLPEGLTEAEFIKVMRTGEDISCEKTPSDPICALGPDTPVLQVMPWPTYHNMTDEQLESIYAYLKALPPANPCNTVANGCPGFSGAAATSASYAYPDSPDCPNPAPPQ
ncbi:MAG: hypothetical protein FWD08_04935 [Alphaproteobacteria bacterium]|nr:hypothetical protein [Alphaproteobacteria bacterium]